MRKVLLTSAGLTENMKELFFDYIGKEPKDTCVIFVPTAATLNDFAREGIAVGIAELLKMGIVQEHILIYDLRLLLSQNHTKTYSQGVEDSSLPPQARLMSADELKKYDAILFCGGNATILLDELYRTGFNQPLIEAVDNGLFYIGVSAGSMIAAGNLPDGLRFVQNPITPHCENRVPCGALPADTEICLADNQAVWVSGDDAVIIE